VEDYLKEQVTEFLANPVRIVFIKRFKQFIGFLNEKRLEALPCLFSFMISTSRRKDIQESISNSDS
jgi:hypothetical protein